ncbi:hypothetical protein AAG747_04535 [Rapidithrix thailandica]|uniref:STAS/SEC14 domain-containing protein n=1 Tax=Rapidithrix thailandica TaxID=413964 RepID=A0AAW9S8U8_9BACT
MQKLSMTQIIEEYWPLVLVVNMGEVTMEGYQTVLDAYGKWLDKEKPFAILNLRDPAGFTSEKGVAQAGKLWMKENKSKMRAYVQGVALLVSEEASFSKMQNLDTQKAFGYPSKVFKDALSALNWLNEEILPSQLTQESKSSLLQLLETYEK